MPEKTAISPKRLQYFQAPAQLLDDLRVSGERNERSLSAEIRFACRAHLAAHGALTDERPAEGEALAPTNPDVGSVRDGAETTPPEPECARVARGAQAGSLLPTPPRRRWRATDDPPRAS